MLRRILFPRTVRTLLAAAALAVCLAPLHAQDSGAKVVYQTGQVSLQNGPYLQALSACTGQVINTSCTVKAQQTIVTGPDGFAKLQVLSDGSTFEVYPNSRVVFRETPGDWEHLLNVWLGRVKVFIQHAPGVPNPNNVTSPTAVISVRGTVFDVVVDDQGATFVSVDEGLVDVRNWTAYGKSVSLHPGESITVYRGQPLLGNQVGRNDLLRAVMQKARELLVYMPRSTPGGSVPVGGTTGTSTSGDRGSGSGSSGGSNPGKPPAPSGPSNPGAPPAPGGGG